MLCGLKSFGVPYMQTSAFSKKNSNNGIVLSPPYQREDRSQFLKSKRPKMQDEISMKWKFQK